MRQNTRVRKRGVVWPDKRRFEDELAAYLRDDARAKIAFKRLMREGCLWGNLMSFLVCLYFSPKTVFEEHSHRRDNALIQRIRKQMRGEVRPKFANCLPESGADFAPPAPCDKGVGSPVSLNRMGARRSSTCSIWIIRRPPARANISGSCGVSPDCSGHVFWGKIRNINFSVSNVVR